MIVIYIYYFDTKLDKICAFYLKFKPGERVWVYNVEISNPVRHKKLGRGYYFYWLRVDNTLRLGYILNVDETEKDISVVVNIISQLYLKPSQKYVSYSWFKIDK